MDSLSGESSRGLHEYMGVLLPSTPFGTAYQSKSQRALFLNDSFFYRCRKVSKKDMILNNYLPKLTGVLGHFLFNNMML